MAYRCNRIQWHEGTEFHKLYLSAILDLCDRRIVSYVLSERNDDPLVFKTFDKAIQDNPDAHPLFHSDRGFQYTNRTFHHKLVQAGMTQSMSRVAHCIDNGPMEGFWGILKRERYYGRRFTSKGDLVQMIENYIRYYNTRLQYQTGAAQFGCLDTNGKAPAFAGRIKSGQQHMAAGRINFIFFHCSLDG